MQYESSPDKENLYPKVRFKTYTSNKLNSKLINYYIQIQTNNFAGIEQNKHQRHVQKRRGQISWEKTDKPDHLPLPLNSSCHEFREISPRF